MFEAILREIQSYDTIILHRHSLPDGDALGSQFGLKYILQASYPHKAIYTV
jgi:phosphoesterase RecJ-like protein